MEVYDLRSQRLRQRIRKDCLSCLCGSDVGREFVVVRGVSNPFHSIDGLTLRHRFEFNPNAVFDPLYAQNLNKIQRLIDSGSGLNRSPSTDKSLYPFFISESGELFCVDETIYNSAFVNYVLERYRNNVALFGKPAPTRDSFVPSTNNYGPGYWKTVEDDYHGTKNVVIMAINRLTSMGDEGRVFGSDGKDYMNTSRDKIQRWTALPGDLDGESRVFISKNLSSDDTENNDPFIRNTLRAMMPGQ
jgi:hypothetical protein